MLRNSIRPMVIAALIALAGNVLVEPSRAASTAFTYQGKLDLDGTPISGTIDVRLTLFDAVTAGVQIDMPQTTFSVPVSNGLFSVSADFGSTAFDGSPRWLEVSIANPAGSAFVTLSPRQEVTAAPVSTHSLKPWESAAGKTWYAGGHVGIGTSDPLTPLSILGNGATKPVGITQNQVGGASTMEFTTTDSADQQASRLVVRGGNDNAPIVFYRGPRGTETETMRIANTGSVGIGVGNPIGSLAYPATWTGLHVASNANGNSGLALVEGDIAARLHLQNRAGAAGSRSLVLDNSSNRAEFKWLNDDLSTRVTPLSMDDQGNVAIGGGLGLAKFYLWNTTNTGPAMRIDSDTGGLTAFCDGGFGLAGTSRSASGAGVVGSASSSTGICYGVRGSCGSPDGWAGYFTGRGYFSDKVGLGRTPLTHRLEVEGDASKTSGGSWFSNSDARIKTSVSTLSGALDTLDRVRLVDYEYTDWYRSQHPSIEKRRYLSVIAQEFAQVFPDFVKPSGETLPSGDAILQVDTYPLTIYSAAAVQELHSQSKDQAQTIETLRDQVKLLTERLERLEKAAGSTR